MSLIVSVYAPTWPFRRRRVLRSVEGVAYAFELMRYGSFEFSLPSPDADGIEAGDLIGIQSSRGVPDFGGGIDQVKAGAGAYTEIAGRELAKILDDRLVAQQRTFAPAAGGDVARELVRRVSGRNPTGIIALPTGASAPIVSSFTTRSESVLDGLDHIAALTGWEWEIRYTADVRLTARFIWTRRVGVDLRNRVRFGPSVLAEYEYEFDALAQRQLVQIVGSTGEYGGRPSAAAVIDAPVTLQDLSTIQLPIRSRRRQRRGVYTSREDAILEASLPDGLSVQRRATEDISLVIAGQETLTISVSAQANWSRLRVGNVVTIALPRVQAGGDFVRPFRIQAMQPDDEAGMCRLTGKVLV